MNPNHSNHTGKVHRSMQSAFGPYTNAQLDTDEEGFGLAARLTYAVAVVGFIILAVFGWLPGA